MASSSDRSALSRRFTTSSKRARDFSKSPFLGGSAAGAGALLGTGLTLPRCAGMARAENLGALGWGPHGFYRDDIIAAMAQWRVWLLPSSAEPWRILAWLTNSPILIWQTRFACFACTNGWEKARWRRLRMRP